MTMSFKKLAGLALSLGVLAAPAWASGNPIDEGRFVRDLQRAKADYDRKDLAGARRWLGQALELRPHSSEALNDLGDVQYRAGDFAAAQKSYEQSGDKGTLPELSRSAYQDGNSLYRQNRLPEAAAAYKQALHWDENDDDARFNLQVVLDKMRSQQKSQPKNQPDKKQSGKDGSKGQSDKQQAEKSGSQGKADKNASKGKPQTAHAEQSRPPASAPRKDGSAPRLTAGTPQMGRPQDDTDRILQYYQNKERRGKLKTAPAVAAPQPGQETW